MENAVVSDARPPNRVIPQAHSEGKALSIKRITFAAIAAGATAVAIAAAPATAQITLEPAPSDQVAPSAHEVGSTMPGTGSFDSLSSGMLCRTLPGSDIVIC
ncbi:hypothetical protein NDR87_11380 [Nocardia sp. CDC159]|uniref:Uncharacterized protein n=1 Tax=Nocardia pulmonis TaxID=2951408 RepID=A0A9X2E4H2_9NOCA|nr:MULTISPECIES: hypothetical protein [Nocardia]MCM6774074.1 hypothetical protein [Nocardia pulmonis]MCM6786961.1 hypothetical protein [Nocardia sp. CDC159]